MKRLSPRLRFTVFPCVNPNLQCCHTRARHEREWEDGRGAKANGWLASDRKSDARSESTARPQRARRWRLAAKKAPSWTKAWMKKSNLSARPCFLLAASPPSQEGSWMATQQQRARSTRMSAALVSIIAPHLVFACQRGPFRPLDILLLLLGG